MTKKQLVSLQLIREASAGIVSELAKTQELVADRRTLEAFQRELQAMEAEISSNQLPPLSQRRRGMGRVIVDSWPLVSPLGAKILAAEQRYLAL
jgi:transposase